MFFFVRLRLQVTNMLCINAQCSLKMQESADQNEESAF